VTSIEGITSDADKDVASSQGTAINRRTTSVATTKWPIVCEFHITTV